MTVHLFQIGDVSAHFHETTFPGYQATSPGKMTDLLWSPRGLWPNTQFQPSVQKQTLRGKLKGDCAWRGEHIHQRLLRLIGVPLDIIGYVILNNEEHDRGGSCGCECSNPQLLWLSTIGVLADVDIDPSRGGGGELDITLRLEWLPFWQPLDRYLWSYEQAQRSPLFPVTAPTPYSAGIKPLPTAEMVFAGRPSTKTFARRVYTSYTAYYDPDLWVALEGQYMPGYPKTGEALSWNTGNAGQTGATVRYVPVPPEMWAAPPLSVYAFKNLPTSGTITVTIRRTQAVFGADVETITINLATFNTALVAAGYGSIQATDVLIMGDVQKLPGFLLRNGVEIDFPRPVVVHKGFWPGMLTPGENFVGIETPANVQHAYHHLYRRA